MRRRASIGPLSGQLQRFPVAAHVRDLPEGGGGQYLGVSHLLANGNLADVLGSSADDLPGGYGFRHDDHRGGR
ncbi:MAG: hypothetical protein A3E79_06210 [Burkholderiales bacterium RIFCSPHIGHO2_12_FULL_61_11]|nr:MAG: hypothetical protein A3E79_06210 [Burkholderiales bacterium RIFCSPHIGHO2_12_FULL_61_11]